MEGAIVSVVARGHALQEQTKKLQSANTKRCYQNLAIKIQRNPNHQDLKPSKTKKRSHRSHRPSKQKPPGRKQQVGRTPQKSMPSVVLTSFGPTSHGPTDRSGERSMAGNPPYVSVRSGRWVSTHERKTDESVCSIIPRKG